MHLLSTRDKKACIIGGGPAGLATAIALRRENYDVTVLDCAAPPKDKACGEGLMPDGLAALRELGIEIPAEAGFAFRGVRFTNGRSSVFANFPNGLAKGLRRTALHEILIEHATRSGVAMIWRAQHVRLAQAGVLFDDGYVEADLVVGADGQNSQIRRQAQLDQVTRETRRYGFRRHYRVAPWSPYVELHWGTRSQIYVTPVAPDEICLAAMSRNAKLRLADVLRDFPELASRVACAEPVSQELGSLSVSRRLRSVQRNNVLLAGDASGSVDAITGEGMGLAFKQALAIAAAIRSGDIRNYQRLHRRLIRRPRTMASLMLLMDRSSQLQARVLAGLARHQYIFASLVGIHIGASRFRDLASWGWRRGRDSNPR